MSSETSQQPLQFVITPDGELFGHDNDEARSLVKRIHASFVACEGLSIEELEKGIVADMRRVIEQVHPILKERVRSSDAA